MKHTKIERAKIGKKLPGALSKSEISSMLVATKNIKHKCLIALIYSCGLRRSEAINMKLGDIDPERMLFNESDAITTLFTMIKEK